MQIGFDKEQARGCWLSILRNLGIEIGDETGRRHFTCPLCGREKTKGMRFTDKAGAGTWICTCGNGDGWDLVQQKFSVDFKGAVETVSEVIGYSQPVAPKEKKKITRDDLNNMFKGATSLSYGDLVDKYLSNRGLTARPTQNVFFKRAAYHAETKQRHPAMFALFHMPVGQAVAFHRTFLRNDGTKLDGVNSNKMMSPALVDSLSGGAVRLFDHSERDVMGIAEGIETALAASQDFGCPFWAATTAILMEKWEPPEGIKTVIVVGDRDTSFTGQAAAYALAKRLAVTKKLNVTVYFPDKTGMDWLDVVNKKCGCIMG